MSTDHPLFWKGSKTYDLVGTRRADQFPPLLLFPITIYIPLWAAIACPLPVSWKREFRHPIFLMRCLRSGRCLRSTMRHLRPPLARCAPPSTSPSAQGTRLGGTHSILHTLAGLTPRGLTNPPSSHPMGMASFPSYTPSSAL